MKDLFRKTAKAIYGNQSFATNFAPYAPEIIPMTLEQHERDVEERYSEFECEQLLTKYNWFRNLKKFAFKKSDVDISQRPGYSIFLKGEEVGFIERVIKDKKYPVRFRVGFCLEDKSNEDGFKWGFLPNWFDTAEDAQKWVNCYYGKIQDKFTFYKEPEPQPEPEPIKEEDDDEW